MPLAEKISAFNRARKWRRFLDAFPPRPEARVLDVGFAEREFQPADNFIEKHYPYPGMLTALGIQAPVTFQARYPAVRAVTYDGRDFPFPDRAFDLCWSNAVLEHVGARTQQVHFLRECRRVARHVFVTTPNRFFPIEVHTRTPLLHYLPKPLFEAYLRGIGKAWATGGYMNLLSRRALRSLLREAGIVEYRIHGNWLLFAPVDFVVIF